MSIITIERKVLEKNDGVAALNRSLLQQHGVFAVNLLSSPGAGKTSILEQTLGTLRGRIRIGVIEGDVQTDLDARRVAQFEVPVVQIVTNGACHLEARLVQQALGKIDVRQLDLSRDRKCRQPGLPGELRSWRSYESSRGQHDGGG